MKNILIIFILICITISCSDNSTSPFVYDNESLSTIYYNRNNQLWKYTYGDRTESRIYNAADKSILSFDYIPGNNTLYFILFEQVDTLNYTYKTTVNKLDENGNLIEIIKNFTHDGEGFSTLLDINVSDDDKYIAFTGTYYEGQYFAIYDIENDKFIQFTGSQYTEYISFFMWGPDNKSIYVHSHEFLVLYNLEDKTITMLGSPNIRDYLSDDYLLSKGYVGERFDYQNKIKTADPEFIYWKESGQKFVYVRNDSMYLFDLENEKSKFLFYIENYRSGIKNIEVLWNNSSNQNYSTPYFNDNDIIVSFDSSGIHSMSVLNDSLFWYVGKRYSISYFRPNWNNRFNSWDKYYFRRKITQEKLHIAEFDFHMWYYALFYTPEYWFLVVTLDDENFNSQEFINKYTEYNNQYKKDYEYFKSLNYPLSLYHKRQEYNKRHLIDLEFQSLFLDYFITRDSVSFKNDIYTLFSDLDTKKLDETFNILNDPEMNENERLIRFYQSIHNNYLNIYGRLIDYDLEEIKEKLLIEELPPDSFTKLGSLYTEDYLKYKKYEYK